MRRLMPFAVAALVLALLAGARLVVEPGLLGSPGGEVYGHAWVQWWHGRALPGWPAGPEGLLVDGGAWPVIDPLPTLLAAAVGRVVGVVAGYDAWILLSVALAFAGGALLARRVDGDPWTGGLVLALAPALQGSLASGLTEDGAVGLAAIALAFVGRRNLLAGVLLGLLAWCGLVVAWYAALAALVLGLAVARDRRQWAGLAGGALLAGFVAAPLALAQADRLSGRGHSFGTVAEQVEPLWRLNPWRGSDLASFLVPGRVDPGDALIRLHPGYLGLAVLALAGLGLARRRHLGWAAVLAVMVLLAPGRRLFFAGHPLGLDNPFAWAAGFLPGGDLLNHHGRALLIAAVALAALASRGAAALGPRAKLAAALVAIDLTTFSPLGLPLPVAEAAPVGVAARLEALSPGPLLVVPIAGPGVLFQRPLLDQRVHGRPLLLSPNRPGLPARFLDDSGRWLSSLAFPDPAPAPEAFLPPPGVAVLVAMEPHVDAVTAVFGPPDLRALDSAAWDLARRGVSSPP